jgi:hypothetical protein
MCVWGSVRTFDLSRQREADMFSTHRFRRRLVRLLAVAVIATAFTGVSSTSAWAAPSVQVDASCDSWRFSISGYPTGALVVNFVTVTVQGRLVHDQQRFDTSFSNGASWFSDTLPKVITVDVRSTGDPNGTNGLTRVVTDSAENCDGVLALAVDCDSWSVSVTNAPTTHATTLTVDIDPAVGTATRVLDERFVESIDRGGPMPSIDQPESFEVTARLGSSTSLSREVNCSPPPTTTTTTSTTEAPPPSTTTTTTTVASAPSTTTTTTTTVAPVSTTPTTVAASGSGVTTTVPSGNDAAVSSDEAIGDEPTDDVVDEAAEDADSGDETVGETAGEASTTTTTATDGDSDASPAGDDGDVVAAGAVVPVAPQPAGTNPIILVLAAIGLLAIGGGGTALFLMNRSR